MKDCSSYGGAIDESGYCPSSFTSEYQIFYLEVLEKYFIPELKAAELLGGDWKLMQDNAPCHKAKSIKAFLSSKGIDMIEWLSYSPNMNPIENIWAWMKTKLANDYPISTSAEMLAVNFLHLGLNNSGNVRQILWTL